MIQVRSMMAAPPPGGVHGCCQDEKQRNENKAKKKMPQLGFEPRFSAAEARTIEFDARVY